MMDRTDFSLLERFANNRDEAAFRTLVERHLPLVHALARRVTGGDDLARDVSQTTFIRLAQRAALLPRNLALPAWLHRTTHSLAVDLVRAEANRKKYEAALPPASMDDTPPEPAWPALAPVIDELVNALPASDRELVVLRFYRNESHATIAGQLGVTEQAARKRTSRALEKLRVLLGKKGIATSSAALATLLPAHAATPVPALLMSIVAGVARDVAPVAPHALNFHLAMTAAQKSTIAAAALVFVASFSYAIRPATADDVVAPVALSAGSGPVAASGAAGRPRASSRHLPGTPEQRMARLREIAAIVSPARHTRELLEFIDLLPPVLYVETAGQLHDLNPAYVTSDLVMVMKTWLKVDGPAAMTWAYGNIPSGKQFLTTWGNLDAPAALAWLQQHLPEATGHDPSGREPLISLLSGLTGQDPAAAFAGLKIVPDEQDRSEALLQLFGNFSFMNPEIAEKLLALSTGDPAHPRMVASQAQSLLSRSLGKEALAALLAEPEAQKSFSVQELFRQWNNEVQSENFSDSPAVACLTTLPDGPAKNEAIAGICLSASHLADAFELLRQNPGAATDLLVSRMGEGCPVDDMPLMIDQIGHMQDQTLREATLASQLKSWLQRSPESAHEWLLQHGPGLPKSVREAIATDSTPAADKP